MAENQNKMVEHRSLGNSDIKITPIGLGAWQFSEGKAFNSVFWAALDTETTNSIVKESLDHGINWIDTAEIYGRGASERGVAKALQTMGVEANNPHIRIATKWWPLLRFAGNIPRSIGKRLQQLTPYGIDLYQVHQPFSFSGIKSQMKNMAKIADQKHIKTIGISNFNANQMKTAYESLEQFGHNLVSNQVKYSILDRTIERNGVLQEAKDLGVTIIAYSPLEQGLLTSKFHEDPTLLEKTPSVRRRILKRQLEKTKDTVDLIKSIANEIDATASQVSLNWIINYYDNVVAIPGASKPQHARDNANSMSIELSKEQMDAIEEISQVFL